MAPKTKSKLSQYPPNSPELETLLGAGYGMTKAEAEAIKKAYEENPLTHPYEVYTRAKAFLAALSAEPKVISTTPAFVRKYAELDE